MTFAQSILVFFVMPILSVVMWVIIAEVILSWLISFRIIDPNGMGGQIYFMVRRFTEPVLSPIRNILPNMQGLDLSPIVAILLIGWINNWLIAGQLVPMLG